MTDKELMEKQAEEHFYRSPKNGLAIRRKDFIAGFVAARANPVESEEVGALVDAVIDLRETCNDQLGAWYSSGAVRKVKLMAENLKGNYEAKKGGR